MIPSAHEQKEDIRLRMMDLEKKLAESEEERSKLEKTCNMLMGAFREEEKMHYEVLNKKYEKFLEDCLVRRRRNDIILRSLCRIEDRSKMLFAKTERLKLLKDRYLSYLKIQEFKQDKNSNNLQRNIPLKTANDVTAKSIRWKSPLALSLRAVEEFKEARGDYLKKAFANDLMSDLVDVEENSPEKSDEFQEHEKQRYSFGRTSGMDFHELQMNSRNEKIGNNENEITRGAIKNDNKIENKHPTDVYYPRDEKPQKGQKSIEKQKEAVKYSESEHREPKWPLPENEDTKPNEINPVIVKSKSLNKLLKNNHYATTLSPKNGSSKEQDAKNKNSSELGDVQKEKDIPCETSPKTDKALPLGLDGIDYQNETYPESFYEQPVHHHNHTSIASDVILEEDETEAELEDEEKNIFDSGEIYGAKYHRSVVEPHVKSASNTESESPVKGYQKSGDVDEVFENVKSEKSELEKSFGEQPSGVHSGRAKSSPSEKSEKSRSAGKSNLIHMLESDSESFQIEHGDEIPGNEDSDFDFSFSKN